MHATRPLSAPQAPPRGSRRPAPARGAWALLAALAAVAPLALAAARPAAADPLLYTLAGVTFDDGAVASGYFTYDKATGEFGPCDIVTTDGQSCRGAHYVPFTTTTGMVPHHTSASKFTSFTIPSEVRTPNIIGLVVHDDADKPGTYALIKGELIDFGGARDSNESSARGKGVRAITGGSLSVTDPSRPAPSDPAPPAEAQKPADPAPAPGLDPGPPSQRP